MNIDLTTYLMLVLGGLIGGILVLPYSIALNKERYAKIPMPMPKFLLLTVIQTFVTLLILTGLGLLAANSVGLSIESPMNIVPMAIVLGLFGGGLTLLIEKTVFDSRLPEAMHQANKRTVAWKGFLASFYGGITEEILVRLFLMSSIVWVVGLVAQTPAGTPVDGAYWIGIVLSTLVFGLLHLPATAAITPLTRMLVFRAILLNGIGGLFFGWLYWQYGLVSAMVAHFTFDIILHVIAPRLMHKPESSSIQLQTVPQE